MFAQLIVFCSAYDMLLGDLYYLYQGDYVLNEVLNEFCWDLVGV